MRYLILFFCSFLCFSSYATNIKIGFIDTNHVITSLTKYKSSIDLISTDFEPKKQELLDLYNHIELLRSKINLAKESDSNELIEAELSKLLKLEQSFKKETEFWQSSMNKQKIELLKEIELIVNQTIDEYATRENYDLILYDNVAFVSDKVDISKEIIDEIEKL
jgi:outer membrane protein